jgi:signal transduction histidine kinase/ActR/RegA family two-component response regulator
MQRTLRRLTTIVSTDPDVVRRGQMLVHLAVALFGLGILVMPLALFGAHPWLDGAVIVVNMATYLIVLGLARHGHVTAGGLLTILLLVLGMLGTAYDPNYPLGGAAFLVVPVLVASLVLRPGQVWLVLLLALGGLGAIIVLSPHAPIATPAGRLLACSVAALLAIVSVLSFLGSKATSLALSAAQMARIAAETAAAKLAQANADLERRVFQRTAALAAERALLAQRVEERTADLRAANAELARAARLKDEFLASMSHELRTPLNAILGVTEALESEIYGDLTVRQHNSLRTITESGQHLLGLINDILDLAKIGAGRLELCFEPVDMLAIAEASVRLVKPIADQKKLKIVMTFDPAVQMLEADARGLKQILVNLLSNAVKFTPAGGEVGLEIRGELAHGQVYCCVWDSGIGIADNDLARIFQPFVQIDGRLAREYVGTGLGLALVARLVDLHGGSIAVASTVGQGSRFTVTLPWRRPTDTFAAAETTVAPEPGGRERQLRVLVAEDNPTNLTMITDYLAAKHYDVVAARDGAEAVSRARSTRPDLILMDIQMPGMDGLEATRCIRADTELAQIPIIALTALAMPHDRERCLAAGATAYLSKPVRLQELVVAIETHGATNLAP